MDFFNNKKCKQNNSKDQKQYTEKTVALNRPYSNETDIQRCVSKRYVLTFAFSIHLTDDCRSMFYVL